MRLGRVCISASYVVDLDDPDMVAEAKECLYEDMMNAYKYDEIGQNIEVEDAPDAKESDIPDFLVESRVLHQEDEEEEEKKGGGGYDGGGIEGAL